MNDTKQSYAGRWVPMPSDGVAFSDIARIRACAPLLPPPGDQVVIELCDAIADVRREARRELLREVVDNVNRRMAKLYTRRTADAYVELCDLRDDLSEDLTAMKEGNDGHTEAMQLRQQEDFDRGAEHGRAEALRELLPALRRAVDALQWCGGSDDFAPGGKARKGWERVVMPVLGDVRAMLEGE